jgi:hypothetical protein
MRETLTEFLTKQGYLPRRATQPHQQELPVPSLADKIVSAARKARFPAKVEQSPANKVARAIVAAARKARQARGEN